MQITDIISLLEETERDAKALAYEEKIRVEAKGEGRVEALDVFKRRLINYVETEYKKEQEQEKENKKEKTNDKKESK